MAYHDRVLVLLFYYSYEPNQTSMLTVDSPLLEHMIDATHPERTKEQHTVDLFVMEEV
jgi:hypothetical protein